MSLGIAGMLGLAGGMAGISSAGNLLNNFVGSWAGNSAKESLNKNVTETNYKIQKKYDEWTIAQDKAYEQWWQDYLYKLQSNEYFDLSRKYATNTAKWAVQGLKNAGLNPILAAIDGNLSSSVGNANPQQSGHSVHGGSVHGASVSGGSSLPPVNLAGALSASSAAQQSAISAKISEKTAPATIETAKSNALKASRDAEIAAADYLTAQQKPQKLIADTLATTASTERTRAEAELIKAQAAKTKVDAVNSAKNSGLSGVSGFVTRMSREISDLTSTTNYDSLDSAFQSLLEGNIKRNAAGVHNNDHSAHWAMDAYRWFNALMMPAYGGGQLLEHYRNPKMRKEINFK